MGSARSAPFFAEPFRFRGTAAPACDASVLEHHFGGQLLDVDLVDESGLPTSSVQWTCAQWFAVAASRKPFRSPDLRPCIRNVPPPAGLRREHLGEPPFPEDLDDLQVSASLFLGSPGSRARLHFDGHHNALRVLHGLKLVVTVSPATDEGGLPAAEVTALSAVLSRLADGAREAFPLGLPGRGGWAPWAAARHAKHLGSLAMRYDWLGPGDAIAIPRGWYHFVHNETLCISVTFWARPASKPTPKPLPLLAPAAALAQREELPAADAGATRRGLAALPGGLLERIAVSLIGETFCLGCAAAVSELCSVSRSFCSVARSDRVWEAAFYHHWGASMEDAAHSERTWRERYAHAQMLVAHEFREKPKAAVKKWAELSWVDPDSPESLASFLYRHRRLLDTRAVGEYLADCRNARTLRLWTHKLLLPFVGVSPEVALRVYLLHLRLPGEAPRIDRMMEYLAEEYCEQNPGVPCSQDAVFVLFFGLLMLSTDLHNPRVKNRMTLAQFITHNRGIDDGNDVPKELLTEMYLSIMGTPLRA